jgi:hypothetical protein
LTWAAFGFSLLFFLSTDTALFGILTLNTNHQDERSRLLKRAKGGLITFAR